VPPFGALLVVGAQSVSFPYVGEIMAYSGGSLFGWWLSLFFVIITVVMSFKTRHFWCRFCPTAISIAILNRLKSLDWIPLLHLCKEGEKCTKCGICKRVCPVQVTEVYDIKGGNVKTSMWMLCLRCLEMCPYEGCLKLNFSQITILESCNYLEPAKSATD
jgi:ferredoxin-type protein NapH